tara:strand:+ start:260 stop:448 length:189 start_codon:yes stop_codon:yes gene_type:complete
LHSGSCHHGDAFCVQCNGINKAGAQLLFSQLIQKDFVADILAWHSFRQSEDECFEVFSEMRG